MYWTSFLFSLIITALAVAFIGLDHEIWALMLTPAAAWFAFLTFALDETEEQVLRPDHVVMQRLCLFLGDDEDTAGTWRESLEHGARLHHETGTTPVKTVLSDRVIHGDR